MTYKPQAGDTTMDEAIGLLQECAEIIETDSLALDREEREKYENLVERVNLFIRKM